MAPLMKKLSMKIKQKKDGSHGKVEQVDPYPDYNEQYERQFRQSLETSNASPSSTASTSTHQTSSPTTRPRATSALHRTRKAEVSTPQRPSLAAGPGLNTPGNAGRHPSTYGLQGSEIPPLSENYGGREDGVIPAGAK